MDSIHYRLNLRSNYLRGDDLKGCTIMHGSQQEVRERVHDEGMVAELAKQIAIVESGLEYYIRTDLP
ncbi:MAG: hypothetical protein MJZ67_03855 [Bacteroidales bacterium]|nr:hypothetical protein [Bacteroidales bacterium]